MRYEFQGRELISRSPKTGTTYPLDTGAYGGNSGYGGRPSATGPHDVNPYSGASMTPAHVSMSAQSIDFNGILGRPDSR